MKLLRWVLHLTLFFWLIPFVWTLCQSVGHYEDVLENQIFLSALRNSLAVALGAGFVTVGLSSWAAYGMTRKETKWNKIFLGLAALVSMYPHIAVASPLFMAFRELGWVNTLFGLVLIYTTFSTPLVLWFLYAYFRKIPTEYDEAASLDGAGDVTIFFKIVIPQAVGGLLTAFVLVFLFVWNEFFFSLVLTIDERSHTLPKVLALFTSRYETAWGEISAAVVMAAIPIFALAFFSKKIFREQEGR